MDVNYIESTGAWLVPKLGVADEVIRGGRKVWDLSRPYGTQDRSYMSTRMVGSVRSSS